MGCMITWTYLSRGRRTGLSEDRYGYIDGVRVAVIVEPVTIRSESANWIVLELYKSTIIVLPREQFVAGLKKGKAWRRAAAMRARQPEAQTSADWRRRAGEKS
jgi:hypothetical protein